MESNAPRHCLLEPIPEIFEAAHLLDVAVDAHLENDFVKAGGLIRQADMPEISVWTEAIWGGFNSKIHRLRDVPNTPPLLPKADRIKVRMPNADEKRMLLDRDGRHCRFCEIPVIDPKVRKAIHKLYPQALPWGSKSAEQHAAFQCMWLQYDHILPHSRGGDNTLDNIAITCAPCNFGRMNYTIEEVGLINPLASLVNKTPWDGLERVLGINQ